MGAAIEWLEGRPAIIRWGPDFKVHGDPYSFTVVLELKDGKAELKAGSGRITTTGRREIFAALKKAGISNITWERRNKPKDRRVSAKTARPT